VKGGCERSSARGAEPTAHDAAAEIPEVEGEPHQHRGAVVEAGVPIHVEARGLAPVDLTAVLRGVLKDELRGLLPQALPSNVRVEPWIPSPCSPTRVVDAGVGLMLDKSRFTEAELGAAIRRVLHDGAFRRPIPAIQSSFRLAGGVRRAADVIEHFVAFGVAPYTRSFHGA
jgi:hypothetical protein